MTAVAVFQTATSARNASSLRK